MAGRNYRTYPAALATKLLHRQVIVCCERNTLANIRAVRGSQTPGFLRAKLLWRRAIWGHNQAPLRQKRDRSLRRDQICIVRTILGLIVGMCAEFILVHIDGVITDAIVGNSRLHSARNLCEPCAGALWVRTGPRRPCEAKLISPHKVSVDGQPSLLVGRRSGAKRRCMGSALLVGLIPVPYYRWIARRLVGFREDRDRPPA